MICPLRSVRQCQNGSAAIEFVLIMFPVIVLLGFSLFLARVFWDYSAMQKAAHDAVRYMATAPASDMSKPAVGLEKPVAAVARQIAQMETSDLTTSSGVKIDIFCDTDLCILGGPPKNVRVKVYATLYNDIFDSEWIDQLTGMYGLLLEANVSEPYVGT